MEFNKHPPEHTALPPELAPRPELELIAPPPEFGQGTSPYQEGKRKRSLRSLLAIPALLLASFLNLHQTTAPSAPASTEPAPVVTAEPVPEHPAGSVVIDVLYAARDAETARYSYVVYSPAPSIDATQEQIDAYKGTPYPIRVYARISDQAEHMIAPAEDPDVWEGSRSSFESSMDVTGLEGELTLTLTAVYTEEGEERQTQAVLPLTALPPAADTYAELHLSQSGEIEYSAIFDPDPADDHVYQYTAERFTFVWLDEDGRPVGETPVLDLDTVPTLNGNSSLRSEKGVMAAYEGPASLVRPSDAATQLLARLILRDQTTNYPYTIDSSVVSLPTEPILSGMLEAFPDGDVYAEFLFLPAPGDTHAYSFRVKGIGQIAFEGDEGNGFSVMDDPGSLPVTGDNESGYKVVYSGGSMLTIIPSDAQLCFILNLEDTSTGEVYRIETNRVDAVTVPKDYETYPLEDGKLAIIVYNDTPDVMVPSPLATTDGYLTLLAMETMPESDFTSYVLPAALQPDGYDFAGWVVHVNNPLDPNAEEDVFTLFGGEPPPEALTEGSTFAFSVSGTLTRDDVERVPPSEDGIRYVIVHAVWIKQEFDEPLLYLDDGFGHTSVYGMETPLASEGYIYLCNYPISAPESGMVFDGWYDSEGNRVDLLVSYFSFATPLYDEDGAFLGYDWSGDYNPIHLTASWK